MKRTSYSHFSWLVGCYLIVAIPFWASAQDLAEDLRSMEQTYAQAEQLTMDVTYRVFPDATATKPLQVEKGQIMRRGNHTYQKIGTVETITTAEYQLVADHTHRAVVLTAGVDVSAPAASLPIEQLQQLLQQCDSVDYQMIDSQTITYTLLVPSSEYRKIAITLDRQQHWMKQITLYYRHAQALASDASDKPTAPRLEITLDNINTRKKVSQDTFAYQNFLQKEHDRYTLNKTYQDYQLINQLH